MRIVPGRLVLLAAGFLCAGSSILAAPADEKPADMKAQDQSISDALAAVINQGAQLYNGGDHNGCYRLYEGSLMMTRALVGHHKDWQKDIDTALAEAGRTSDSSDRAFVLREAMNKIRKAVKDTNGGAAKPPDKGKTATLWDRLGGEAGARKIVDEFMDLAGKDPAVDFFRGGKYKDADIKHLKQELVELVSAASGGPLKYSGKDLKTVHKGMGITNEQFDACALDLRKALKMNKVKDEDVTELMTVVGLTRSDIVEPAPEKKPK